MWSKPCLVKTRFMELMQPRLFSVSSLGTRSSLSSNLPATSTNIVSAFDEAWPAELWTERELTGQEKTRERDNVKLLHRDVVAVHEQVQQVDGQVSGCRTQPKVVADNGHKVGKVSSQAELRRLSFVRRQLELLKTKQKKNNPHIQAETAEKKPEPL